MPGPFVHDIDPVNEQGGPFCLRWFVSIYITVIKGLFLTTPDAQRYRHHHAGGLHPGSALGLHPVDGMSS